MRAGLRERERVVGRRIVVYVAADDEVSRTGVVAHLRSTGQIDVTDQSELASVAVVVVEHIDDRATQTIRHALALGSCSVVVVATNLDDLAVVRAAEAGACSIVRRSEIGARRLAAVIVGAVEGDGALPPDLLGAMLSRVGTLQRHMSGPNGVRFHGFTDREVEVLRLVAEGYDTEEVAAKLSYSERTVKNVLHDVTTRFNLRNRCHAIAFAMRAGVI